MNKTIKYYLLVLLAIPLAFTANAQDSRQAAFEESVDFVKCKCAEIIYGAKLNCENSPATAQVEQYASRHPRTGTLMGELDRLKKTQVEAMPTDSIAQLLSTGIFHADNRVTYPQSYNFSTNRGRNTNGTINTLSETITQFVQNRIPDLPTSADLTVMQDSLTEADLPPALIPDGSVAVDDSSINSRDTHYPFLSFHLNIAHVLIAVLAVLASWFLISRTRRDYENQISELRFRIDSKAEASELIKVENEIARFTKKLEEARKKRLADKETRAKQPIRVADANHVPGQMRVEKILYLPAPRVAGAFHVADASAKFQPAVSVYKFKIDPSNPNMATFSFHSDNMGLQHAIGNPATYIKPVCQETSPIHPGAKYVMTVKPGFATKNGDNWIVAENQKALIRYE